MRNSTVMVINSVLSDIENDPEFGKKLATMIRQVEVNGKQMDVMTPNAWLAATVIESHEVNTTAVVAVGGNYGVVVGNTECNLGHHEWKIEILKELAEEMGYKLIKRIKHAKVEKASI